MRFPFIGIGAALLIGVGVAVIPFRRGAPVPFVSDLRCLYGCSAPALQVLPFGPLPNQVATGQPLSTASGKPITVTRASNKTCSTGITQDPAQLMVDPEKLSSSAWSPFQVTVPRSGVGPDGVANSYAFTDNAVNDLHFIQAGGTNVAETGQYTFSAYLKQGTARYINIFFGVNGKGATFDLLAGAMTHAYGAVTTTVTHADLGYWQASVTFTSTSIDQPYFVGNPNNLANSAPGYSGTGQTVFIADTKLELSASPTPYQFTGGHNNQALVYVTANQPCVDANGLNVEAAATNMLTYTNQIGIADWGNGGGGGAAAPVITQNAGIAPDGTLTATRADFAATTAGQTSYLYNNHDTGSAAAGTYTASVWIKGVSGPGSTYLFEQGAPLTNTLCSFTTSWTRCSYAFTTTGVGFYTILGSNPANSNTPVGSAASVYVWGIQVEGGFGHPLTSYISTVASTASRSADVPVAPSVPTGHTISFGADILTAKPENGAAIFVPSVDDSSDLWEMSFFSAGTIKCEYYNGSSDFSVVSTAAVTGGVKARVACTYDGANLSACVNGACTKAAQSFVPLSTAYTLEIGNYGGFSQGDPTDYSRVCMDSSPLGCQ